MPYAEVALLLVTAFWGVALWRAYRLHGHWHEHGDTRHWHVHSHRHDESHEHGHAALLGIGMLHGLAGTGALVVMLPLTVGGSPSRSLWWYSSTSPPPVVPSIRIEARKSCERVSGFASQIAWS